MRQKFHRGLLCFCVIFLLSFSNSQANQPTFSSSDLHFDWRDYGYDFPVHDQGNCNAGYAFAAVDTVQAAIWKKDNEKINFSVNHAKECNWHAINHYAGLPNTCEGGSFKMLTNLFTQEGLVLETCDSYLDYDDVCSTYCDPESLTPCSPKCTPSYYITEWHQFSKSYPTASVSLIKTKLVELGPLYTQMDPKLSGFSTYPGGYVLKGGSTDPNQWTHGVLIIGWDDNLTYTGGKGAWIVKNSYGSEWGDDGYFFIAYGNAGIGSSLATVTDWNVVSTINKFHYYDEGGFTSQVATSDTDFYNGSSMGLFSLEQNEIPRSVEFWTNGEARVNVKIFEYFDGNEPKNLLYQSEDIIAPFSGYYQIDIHQKLDLPEMNQIAVVLSVSNLSTFFPLVVDGHGPPSDNKTWYLDDQGQWKSLVNFQNKSFDAGIRLRTILMPEGLNHMIFLPIISVR